MFTRLKGTVTGAKTYMGMHANLRHYRGSAKFYVCRCGAQAAEWAYDHGDPDEITSYNSNGYDTVFSRDLSHYKPLCKSCHIMLDDAYRAAHRD